MKIDLVKALAAARDDVVKSAGDGSAPVTGFVPTGSLNQPVRAEWDFRRADRDGFKACSWVYACIERLRGAVSSVPWKVMERTGRNSGKVSGGSWEQQPDSPYELAIEYPNQIMSRQFLIGSQVQHLGIVGNGLLKSVTVTRKGRPVPDEFWPLSPDVWRPVPDEVRWISGYQNRSRPYTPPLEVGQVVHSQFPDPTNLLWGQSPMRAIARVIDMDVAQVAWNAALPSNRMTPEVAIVDRNLKTDVQLDEAFERLKQRYAGPDRAGAPMMLGAGGEVIRLSFSPEEMDWIESRRFSLLEICAAYGLIPSLFVPDAKYSNQEVAVKYMWENGATMILELLQDAFNTRLIPRELRSKLWIHYDTSAVPALKDSLEKRLEAHERAIRSGIPINRSFVMLDLPLDPVEGGDEPLVLGTLEPLERILAEPETGPGPNAVDGGVPDGGGDGEDPAGSGADGTQEGGEEPAQSAAA